MIRVPLAVPAPEASAQRPLMVRAPPRRDHGEAIHDRKGIVGDVRLNGMSPHRWRNRALPLDDLGPVRFGPATAEVGPAFYRGTVTVAEPRDTYLALDGWMKGNAWINGFHFGRYWSRGPQRSLYVPGPVLHAGDNEIVLLELHTAPCLRTVDLRDHPDLGSTES